ncbi:hypothetical protein [Ktedonobacter robiniae]|uniref:hypothetical protein n=1 Tax=Ktedonobacter robiniae TaxID=2778365 RepID=UPI0019164B26|nr:hypothetical protein [Ktedonobacter robiniae]
MQYQDNQMEEPTIISTSQAHRYTPSQHSNTISVLKHGFLVGAILAGIVIVTTIIFTTPVVSNALFSIFASSYLFGLLYQGNIVISLIVTALCTPVYFFTGYFTRKYSALACLIALACFLFVDACSYLVILSGSISRYTSLKDTLVIYIFAYLVDLFLALIVGFGVTGVGAAFRKNQEGKAFPRY